MIDADTRYSDDPAAQAFVAEHPDGATLQQVADAMGLCRARLVMVEWRALRRLRERLALRGVGPEDVLDRMSLGEWLEMDGDG